MSLICDETKKDIKFGDPLFVATQEDKRILYALCHEVIDKIPKKERIKKGKKSQGKIDIYSATSSKNHLGNYSCLGIRRGDFLFSLSKEAVEKYLPKQYKNFFTLG